MNWFYVDGGQQAGPVTDEQLAALRSAGKVTDETLVWHEGLSNWAPLKEAQPASGVPASGAALPDSAEAKPGAVCVECGQLFNIEDMIRHGDAYVCAGCKPVFLQKLSEGIVTGLRRGCRSLPVNADTLVNEVVARGIEVNIGQCVSRAWELLKANFWLSVGATLLVMLCNQAAGFIPILGILLSLMIQGPLMGGLCRFFLKLVRGEQAGIGDAFSGFANGFWRLCGTFILMLVLIYLCLVPFGIYAFYTLGGSGGHLGPLFWILGGVLMLAMLYVAVCFSFALPLAADLELGPWDALRTSWRVVSRRWFTMLGLMIVGVVLSMLGVFACLIGVIFTMPLFYLVTLYAYEDIFGIGPATYGNRR